MATANTLPISIDLEPVSKQLKAIAYEAAEDAYKAVSGHKHAFSEYMNRKALYEYLGVSNSYISVLEREGLPTILIGSNRMYRKATVDKWMEAHQIGTV